MTPGNLEHDLMQIARELNDRGEGFALYTVAMFEARRRLGPKSLQEEQTILQAWNRLFDEGKLVWGWDLDNPGAPWFHVPVSPDFNRAADYVLQKNEELYRRLG